MQITFSLEQLARLAGKEAKEVQDALLDNSAEGEEPKLKEDAADLASALIREKISAVGTDQYGRGKRETMESVEKWAKKQGATGDGMGFDLLDSWVENLRASATPSKVEAKELTFEALEKNEIAKQWFEQRTTKLREDLENTKTEYQQYQERIKQEQVQQTARQRALEILQANKWNAGEDEEQQKVRRKLMFKLLEDVNIDLTDNNEIILLDKENNPIKDDYHNPVKFEDFVLKNNPFGFHKVDPQNGSPSPKEQRKDGKAAGIVIRDKADFENRMKTIESKYRPGTKEYLQNKSELRRAYSDYLRGNAS